MASSTESSDESLEKFAGIAEIVDSETIGASRLRENVPGNCGINSKTSLRYWRESDAFSESQLISPEFRHHVAKKLSKFLDSNLICSQIDEHSQNGSPNNLCESSGIKLLLTSRKRLSGNFIEEVSCPTVKQKDKKLNSSSGGSDTDEEELSRFAEAAVSGHFIMQNSSCQSKEEEESKNIVKTNVETKKQKKERKKEFSDGDELQTKKKHKKLKKEKHKT